MEKALSLEEIKLIKDDVIELLYKVGEVLIKWYNQNDKDITFKRDMNDLLTQYDIKINSEILWHLKAKYPSISIISEEDKPIFNKSEYSFLVDPIDWTRNFVRWIPMTFIWVWLALWKRTILSVTFNPITNEMFRAIKDHWAFLNNQTIKVSKRTLELSDICIRTLPNKKLEKDVVTKFVEKAHQVKNNMCSHEEISWIACDKYDAFISKGSSPWDYCHYLLVEEAWWTVTDWNWEEFDISKDNIILSNWIIHKAIIDTKD